MLTEIKVEKRLRNPLHALTVMVMSVVSESEKGNEMSAWTEKVKRTVASAIKYGIDGKGPGFAMSNAKVFDGGAHIFTPFEMKLDSWLDRMTE